MKIPNDAPTGVVTFLFTDLEGSTKLAEKDPIGLQTALDAHNKLISDEIESNGGIVFDIAGDSFCCAFSDTDDAISSAAGIQRRLEDVQNGEMKLKVRIGIHRGPAEWHNGKYMGYITLARSARIMSAANGGQILISEEALSSEGRKLREDISFRDLGLRRLKDLIQPLRLYQVLSPGIAEDFPPLKTLDARPNNIPVQLTSFIGRKNELSRLRELLGTTRQLTLTGTGGAGKTRLSIQLGADMIDEFPNGVWLVEFASISEPALIAEAIIHALAVSEEAEKSPEATLIDHLSDKEMLLIFDNCEHIVDKAAETVEVLLSRCARLRIVATSREALRCHGEQCHPVLPLQFPNQGRFESLEALTQYEAVRLFIERALAVDSAFRVNNANAPFLAEICCRLDGIPLAIELAAARTKVLSLESICKRLDDRFRLLTGGLRTSLRRQQTLRAMIDWSYDLLDEKEKVLWRRLSVFNGGWTFDAAETVCGEDPLDRDEIFDLLSNLAEKSIIVSVNSGERLRMLESIRQYGAELLEQSGEAESVSDKYADYFLALSESNATKLRGADAQHHLTVLSNELSNFEFVLKSCAERRKSDKGLRLASLLTGFWQMRGYLSEGTRLLRLFTSEEPAEMNEEYAAALSGLASFERIQGRYAVARNLLERASVFFSEAGHIAGLSECLNRLGINEFDSGNYAQAAKHYERNLELQRSAGDEFGMARTLNNLANAEMNLGNYIKSEALLDECLYLRRKTGDEYGVAITLSNIGILAYQRGMYEKATSALLESLEYRKQFEDHSGEAICLINLGNVAYNQGDYGKAVAHYEKSLKIFRESGELSGIADSLINLAKTALEEGLTEKAEELARENLEFAETSGNKGLMATWLYIFGRISFIKGNIADALSEYRKSLSLYMKAEYVEDAGLNFIRIAECMHELGNSARAAVIAGFTRMQFIETYKLQFPKADGQALQRITEELLASLGESEFGIHSMQGANMTLALATDFALED